MKRIVAIIKPFKFHEVSDALQDVGVQGVIVTEVQGLGRQMGHTELYAGKPYAAAFLPKVMVEIVLHASQLDHAVAAIRKSAQTGRIGDGKIFITTVEQAVRIRTGETGAAAV